MKYSFMSFSTPELTLGGMLDAAKRYGYDGIEPRMDSGHAHGIETAAPAARRQAVRDDVAASGVALACLATSLNLKLVPIGHGEIDHRRAIDLLAADGYKGFISGEWIDWEPWTVHLPRELETLKRYENDVQR